MDLWQALVFFIFPIASVILMFLLKRKILWISPFISTVLSIVYSIIVMPGILTDAESLIFWAITIPLQFVVATIFTVIAYFMSWLLKNESSKINKSK